MIPMMISVILCPVIATFGFLDVFQLRNKLSFGGDSPAVFEGHGLNVLHSPPV